MPYKIAQVYDHVLATRVERKGSPIVHLMKGLLIMPKTSDNPKAPRREIQLSVPTKAEMLEVIQHDGGRAGLQLEWMLDRCSGRERAV